MQTQDEVEVLSPEIVVEKSNAPLVGTDEGQKLLATLNPLVPLVTEYQEWANGLVVRNESEAAEANAKLKLIAGNKKLVEETVAAHKDAAKKVHSMWCSFEQRFLNPFDTAYRAAKKKIQDWQIAEQQKAEAERKRLQAIADEKARKEREKQEQAAAEQRRIEEEARRKADEARQKAEQADEDERKRLLAEADRSDREANKAAVKAETKSDAAAQTVAPSIHVAAPKSGVRIQKRWVVASVDRAAFIAACAVRPDLIGFLTIETGKMERAKAANPETDIPGIKFEQKVV